MQKIVNNKASSENISEPYVSNLIKIQVRAVFLTIQNINTAKDCFTAEVYIEGRWKYDNHNVDQYSTAFIPDWKPNLQISNMITEFKTETWYRLGKDNDGLYAFEMKKIKGIFYSNWILYNYPFDTQDLSIDIVASQSLAICYLVKHKVKMSDIITKTFRSCQEWYLYEYVTVVENQVDISTKYSVDDSQHSLIRFSCHAARIPTYFYWNSFFPIFLITLIGFTSFAVPLYKQDSRIIISVTLMLTSVSFKWVIDRRLPPISYLTYLDIYSIFGITWTTFLSAYHAIYRYYYQISDNPLKERSILILISGLFFVINFMFVVYLIVVIYKPRRLVEEREKIFKEEFNRTIENSKHYELIFLI